MVVAVIGVGGSVGLAACWSLCVRPFFRLFPFFFSSNDCLTQKRLIWKFLDDRCSSGEEVKRSLCIDDRNLLHVLIVLYARVTDRRRFYGQSVRRFDAVYQYIWGIVVSNSQIVALNVSSCGRTVLWKEMRLQISVLTSENARCTLRQSVRAVEGTSQRSNNHYRRRHPWGRPKDRRQWLSRQGSCHSNSKSKGQVHLGQWAISQDLLHCLRLYVSAS